jgi:hypothetical protein
MYIIAGGGGYVTPPLPETQTHPEAKAPPPPSASAVRTINGDYSNVTSAEAAVAAAGAIAVHTIGVPPQIADESLIADQKKLAAAQARLQSDLQTLLLPNQSQGYKNGTVTAEANVLKGVFHNLHLQSDIDEAGSSLQHSLDGLFGKPGDRNSLRTQIQDGNWTAAEHTEAAQIAAAGKGISNLTQRETAMETVAGELATFGPASSSYDASIDKAFDAAAVRPMVIRLNQIYSDPSSQLPATSANAANLTSRAGAFARAFMQDMQGSTPQVRIGLLEDLLGEKNSPLLAAARAIRAASNNKSLGQATAPLVGIARDRAAGITLILPPRVGIPPPPSGTDIWGISSTAELDSAYRDLAAATDLAAIADTVGTGTGLIHQVAAAILGDPNSANAAGHANLSVLDTSVRNAAADGNVNLSAEIAGILETSGQKSAASTVLTYASQGVAQFEARIKQDVVNVTQLPQSLQLPVGSVAKLFSNPKTAQSAITAYLAANPKISQQVQDKLKQDLAILDLDGQGVVRVYFAVNDMLPTLMGSPGAKSLAVANDNLVNDSNDLLAISVSPAAQWELAYRGDQALIAQSVTQSVPGFNVSNQSWNSRRGLQSFPPGILWMGRGVTSIFAKMQEKGTYGPLVNPLTFPGSPLNNLSSLNLNLTGTVAQQIDDLAQDGSVWGTGAGAPPVNIDANLAQISQLKDRTLTLQFGPWKVSSAASTQQIKTLTQEMQDDPNYKTLKALQGRLALTSDPTQRLALMTQISDVEAKSVNEQLDWMTQKAQAAGDKALVTRIADLRQSYQAAQQRMQSIDMATVGSQSLPTAANVRAWVNRVGKLAGSNELTATEGGNALKTQLEALDPGVRAALESGTYAGSIDALPKQFVSTLQQYADTQLKLGSGPKMGLLPTAEGGLAFSAFKMIQMVGGAAFLTYLGLRPGGSWLNTAFGVTLGAASAAPSLAEFSSGALQKLAGSNLSNIPLVGDWLDGTTLFTRGVTSGAISTALGSLASWAWTPLMGIWSVQEFQAHNPIQGVASGLMGLSYLLPELFADSAWAGPLSAFIDLAGVTVVVGDTIFGTERTINQYDGQIQSLLEKAGLHPDIAFNLAQPDSQGIAAVVRMGEIFDAIPYYNNPRNETLNDQRRLEFLNSLTPAQTALLREGLLSMPLNKSGQISMAGARNIVIPPPPKSMSPADVQQYYTSEYRKLGLPLPPDPGTVEFYGVPKSNYATYYEMYTEDLAQTGQGSFQLGQLQELTDVNKNDPPPFGWQALHPNNLQGFLYYAAAMGLDLKGNFASGTG